jgi:hypothetical protein
MERRSQLLQSNAGQLQRIHRAQFKPSARLKSFLGALLLVGASGGGASAQEVLDAISVPKESVPEDIRPFSFGASDQYFRVRIETPGRTGSIPLRPEGVEALDAGTIRLFWLDERRGTWIPLESHFNRRDGHVNARLGAGGLVTALGLSRFDVIREAQGALCLAPQQDFPEAFERICTEIDCPALEFASGADPEELGPGELIGAGNICERCTTPGSSRPASLAECRLGRPAFEVPPGKLIPWPKPALVANDACRPGRYPVGRVSYDFEDDFDLVPSGGGSPAYPDVDVRAVVRYPARSSGDDTPIAFGRFPLVLFLHGNHATCPCSCSHACAPADRIPNHIGYNYLLDILASQGFIAVSIDGFDVTCAGSPTMSDYEARGRLMLRHLELWRNWNLAGGDPWGNRFRRHVDMSRIGLSGHSRGGEGVVAAEQINRLEGLGFDIKAVNAIAPTDQDPFIDWIPEVPYYLLLAASDGDVSNLQGLRTYDRTSLQGASPQSLKTMAWVYGANHNFFNTAWTPASGVACAFDDGVGEGRLSPEAQRLSVCQTIVPFFRLHLRTESMSHQLFQGDLRLEGLDGVEMYWAYQHPRRLEVDNFDDANGPGQNSLGGSVNVSGPVAVFDEFEFRPSGTTFDSSFRGDTDGLVLAWDADRVYTTALPPGHRDVSRFRALSLRASQLLSQAARNPLDEPRTLRITLQTGSGQQANAEFEVSGVETVPYPYEYNGGKSVLTTLRMPLESFRLGSGRLPLSDIAAITIELLDQGALAIDDIQFTR